MISVGRSVRQLSAVVFAIDVVRNLTWAANRPNLTEILSTEQVSIRYEIKSGVEIPDADD